MGKHLYLWTAHSPRVAHTLLLISSSVYSYHTANIKLQEINIRSKGFVWQNISYSTMLDNNYTGVDSACQYLRSQQKGGTTVPSVGFTQKDGGIMPQHSWLEQAVCESMSVHLLPLPQNKPPASLVTNSLGNGVCVHVHCHVLFSLTRWLDHANESNGYPAALVHPKGNYV